jgi:hypothetical protein
MKDWCDLSARLNTAVFTVHSSIMTLAERRLTQDMRRGQVHTPR